MRVLVAPDSFGDTLSAAQAAAAIAVGWVRGAAGDDVGLAPLSDGGPGLVEVLATSLTDARRRAVEVPDPLGRPVRAELLLDTRDGRTTAWVESAQACGLHHLPAAERDPLRATTLGVGVLLRAALEAGADRLVVGLGGSATNDGGAGMLAALGHVVVDAHGQPLPPGGAALLGAAGLTGPDRSPLAGVEVVAATDVDAPLLGPQGASAVFCPQKGASPDDVALLDAALGRWADVLEAAVGRRVRDLPGAGAAGGLGAALLALGAHREPGLRLVGDVVDLAGRVAGVDLVVTGEGRFDSTSLRGKVVSGVAAAAVAAGVPCIVLAGQVAAGRREAAAAGIEEAYAMADVAGLEASFADPAGVLAALAERVAGQWSR